MALFERVTVTNVQPTPLFNAQDFSDFLFNPAQRDYTFRQDERIFLLLKVHYNETVNFLYQLCQYKSDSALEIGKNPDYVGFVSYCTHRLYDAGYDLRVMLNIAFEERLDRAYLLKRLEIAIKKQIQQLVNNQPVPITAAAKDIHGEDVQRENHLKYGAQSEAYNWF